MKVRVKYKVSFVVTREVEVDGEELRYWRGFQAEHGAHYQTTEAAIEDFLSDDENMSGVLRDLETTKALPRDFELWEARADRVELVPVSDGSGS